MPKSNFELQDLNNVSTKDNDAIKDYTEKTAYEQQVVDMQTKFSTGSIKITKELAAQAILALEERIKDTRDYTQERIKKINESIKLYNSDPTVGSDGKSLENVFLPEIYNACEDLSDSLYLTFENMVSSLELSDMGDKTKQFLARSLEVTEVNDEKKMGFLRSLLKMVVGQNLKEDDIFYFMRKDVIKSFLERGINRSGFKEKVEKFLDDGIKRGHFILKDDWGQTGEYKLCYTKDGMKYQLDQEDVFKFKPVDARMLIFPKHGFEWVAEIINTKFSDILGVITDVNGKIVDNPKYDPNMVKLVGKRLKEIGASKAKVKEKTIEELHMEENDTQLTDLMDIGGNLSILEGHAIPLYVDQGKGKMIYKYMITYVNLCASEGDKLDFDKLDLIPIGIQKTPYVAGIPYLDTVYSEEDGDCSGRSLPQILKPLQKIMNNLVAHSLDNIYMSIWGVMVIDPNAFLDVKDLKNITPRKIMQLKGSLKGRRASDYIEWIHPKVDTLGSVFNLFGEFKTALRDTSRQGPGAKKVEPNPTATEISNIIQEAEKSTTKVSLRLNNLFNKWLERMYVYYMLNLKDSISIKPQGFRLKDKNKDSALNKLRDDMAEDNIADYDTTNRGIEVTPQELFIDGLNFKLTAADVYGKKAVQKQQSMQMYNLLTKSGAITGADGQPVIMKDDTGAPVKISLYRLTKNLLDHFEMDDIFEKITPEQAKRFSALTNIDPSMGLAPKNNSGTAVPVPPLTASNTQSDIARQATTLSPGVNI